MSVRVHELTLAVHTVFVIPSGKENKNFFISRHGKLARVSDELDFFIETNN